MNDQMPTHALSVRQPWAWLICSGAKLFENRQWGLSNPCRRFTGPVWIHAGQGMTKDEYLGAEICAAELGIVLPPAEDLLRGGIVGRCEIVKWHDSPPPGMPFAFSSGLELANVQAVEFLPCKGQLGFFRPELNPEKRMVKKSPESQKELF
jgi:hypothetical protein